MATKVKDGPTGKEKRGTSPSSSLNRPIDPASRKRSPKLQSGQPSSPDKGPPSMTTRSPDKHNIPNYLKSTISSRVDQSSPQKYVPKKHYLPEDPLTLKKPILSRRSSFDKPPSPSKVHKPLVSATSFKERERPPMHHLTPSLSLKPSTSRKPISERPVATKTQTKTVYRPIRSTSGPSTVLKSKTTKPVMKNNSTTTVKTNDVNSIPEALYDGEKSPELEGEVESDESLMNDVEEELVKVESGVELFPADVSTPPKTNQSVDESTTHDDLKTGEETQEETHEEDEQHKLDDIPTVTEDQNNTPDQTEDKHDEPQQMDEEKENEIKQIKEETTDTEESSTIQPEPEVDEEVAKHEEREEETKAMATDQGAKPEASTAQAMKRPAANKKENAPAYNDVIEETASKLLEKRKNKVRALVGAFETVISLEEA